MKINAFIETILVIIFAILPFAYLAFIWNTLPEKVALHFGIDGQPDGFGAKSQLLVPVSLMMGSSILIYFLMKNIHKIDPKQAAKSSKDTFDKIGFTLLVLMSLVSVYITHSAISKQTDNFLFGLVGLLFVAFGNLMHSLKQNYFVGLRLPWTLENENNWRKTHQLASKIWFASGLFLIACALVFPHKTAFILMLSTVFVMILIPTIYSYRLFKKGNQ